MIIDSLKRSRLYNGVHPYFAAAMELAGRLVKENAPVGRYDGENGVYALVSEYETKTAAKLRLENHRDYIDVQILIAGEERVAVADAEACELETEYKPDAEFYNEPQSGRHNITLCGGLFAVFFPGDAHAPGLSLGEESAKVRKLVVKIPVIK